MSKKDKLETLDEMFEKARVKPETDWLEDIHSQSDSWQKTECPFQTEMFTWKDDGYNEQRGGTYEIDGLKSESTSSITVDRVQFDSDGTKHETTWDVDVEIFVYKDYLYTITSEHIHDAMTFTCQSITRRPLIEGRAVVAV